MAGSIFRIKDLSAYTKLSRSTIYDRLNAKSKRYDPTFPKSFLLTTGTVGWFKEDIDQWLEKCASPTSNTQPSTAPALGSDSDIVHAVRSTQPKSKQVSSGGKSSTTGDATCKCKRIKSSAKSWGLNSSGCSTKCEYCELFKYGCLDASDGGFIGEWYSRFS